MEEIALKSFHNSINNLSSNKFSDNFWDEKSNGYDVLNQNLRSLQTTVKELELYLRECANSEDQYVKQLNKVTAQMQMFTSDTSVSPVYALIKDLNEHTAWTHLHYMNRIHELNKEIQSYYTDLRKKKKKIRQGETKTAQIVEEFRATKQQLAKSKEQYHQLCFELEKQKQTLEINQQQATPNPSVLSSLNNNISRLEKRVQNSLEEYKMAIDKYNAFRVEYEQKFTDSCNIFQAHEEAHISQIKTFLFSYIQLVAQLNASRQKNLNECNHKLNNMCTNEYLLQQFLVVKSTGQSRPNDVEFVEYQNSNLLYTNIESRSLANSSQHISQNYLNELNSSNQSILGVKNSNTNGSVSSKRSESKGFSLFFI
jgi:DNA repair exonuclease SbcCD ATPase subunit